MNKKIGEIGEKIQRIADDFLNDPRWADIPSFIKQLDVKQLLPTMKKYDAERKNMLPTMSSISHSIHQGFSPGEHELEKYFSYYGVNYEDSDINISALKSGSYELATYCFSPKSKKKLGTVLVIHGYFEHSLLNATLINSLIKRGYIVRTFDLPGHGFSSGVRFDIDDFRSYGNSVKDVLGSLPTAPDVIIGHSTGCAAIIDFLGRGGTFSGKVIFAAPLVKSYMYDHSVHGYKVVSKVTKNIPYIFHKHSNDPNFLLFKRFGDVHRPVKVPLGWFESLIAWNGVNIDFNVVENDQVYILQGTYDRTVEWKSNLSFLKKMFPNSKETMLDGAEHNIYNDTPEHCSRALEKTMAIVMEE